MSSKINKITKYVLFFCLMSCFSCVVMAQQGSHPVHFEDSFTVLFPIKPEATKKDTFSTTYTAETVMGTFMVIKEKHGDEPMFSSNAALDGSKSGAIQWMSEDPIRHSF